MQRTPPAANPDAYIAALSGWQRDCAGWLQSGDLLYREDIVDGLDAAPAAFAGLLEGRNFGKLLVRVSPDPTRRQ